MPALLDRIDTLEKVGELVNKSYKNAEIARALDISPAQAKHYTNQYKELLKQRVEEDPEFMERLQENTLEALDRLDMLIKEAWETYDSCKTNDMTNQQINLLKVAGDLEDKRSKLLQLMGAKVDGGMMARMKRAERVNEIVTRAIKEVVADCQHCKVEVMQRLAEAFAIMNKEAEVDMEPVVEDDIIEEMGSEEHNLLVLDVIAKE